MKQQYLLFLFAFISCRNQTSEIHVSNTIPEDTQEISITQETFLKTDTIAITENEETSKNTYILAHLLDQKADQDSIVTMKYRLDFYRNKTKATSSKITIKGYEKGSEWGASYGITSATAKNSPFIHVSFGYPACGYNQNNYLYYLKNNDIQLVYQWDSMSDSGWGSWVEFINKTDKAEPESFYCKTVSYEPENDDENMGTVSYSDSIIFKLEGNRWKKQLLSSKDKSYFIKKVPFDTFYSQK